MVISSCPISFYLIFIVYSINIFSILTFIIAEIWYSIKCSSYSVTLLYYSWLLKDITESQSKESLQRHDTTLAQTGLKN